MEFIVHLLHKNITFSGRTNLWDVLFQIIREKPLLGYGVQSEMEAIALTGYKFGTNAHGIVMQYLYQGGAIQLTLYILMLVVIYRRLRRTQDRAITQGISSVLFAFQIMGLAEAYQRHPILFSLYYFAYFAGSISGIQPILVQSSKSRRRRGKKVALLDNQS